LDQLHSITNTKERGSQVSKKAGLLFNKFIKQVEKNFKNLPNPLEWRSFFNNDLPLLMDICKEVQEVSIQHQTLNLSWSEGLSVFSYESRAGDPFF